MRSPAAIRSQGASAEIVAFFPGILCATAGYGDPALVA